MPKSNTKKRRLCETPPVDKNHPQGESAFKKGKIAGYSLIRLSPSSTPGRYPISRGIQSPLLLRATSVGNENRGPNYVRFWSLRCPDRFGDMNKGKHQVPPEPASDEHKHAPSVGRSRKGEGSSGVGLDAKPDVGDGGGGRGGSGSSSLLINAHVLSYDNVFFFFLATLVTVLPFIRDV